MAFEIVTHGTLLLLFFHLAFMNSIITLYGWSSKVSGALSKIILCATRFDF